MIFTYSSAARIVHYNKIKARDISGINYVKKSCTYLKGYWYKAAIICPDKIDVQNNV